MKLISTHIHKFEHLPKSFCNWLDRLEKKNTHTHKTNMLESARIRKKNSMELQLLPGADEQ